MTERQRRERREQAEQQQAAQRVKAGQKQQARNQANTVLAKNRGGHHRI